jgi:hypothetical protein
MTATSMPRHKGSTGQRGLAPFWGTVLTPGSRIFLHTASYQVRIEN